MINLSMIERAHECFKYSNFDDALKYYLYELSVDPANPSILINIGFVYYYKYDFKRAKAFFLNSLKHDEHNQISWFGLYLTAKKMGDRQLERECLFKVYKINEIPFDMLMENIRTFYHN